jgi:hypothetical protein
MLLLDQALKDSLRHLCWGCGQHNPIDEHIMNEHDAHCLKKLRYWIVYVGITQHAGHHSNTLFHALRCLTRHCRWYITSSCTIPFS